MFRKGLVVIQFSISIFLIIAIGVIYQQLNFIKNKDLGFNKEKVLFVKARANVNRKFETFRNELLKKSDILNVSGTSDIPGNGANGSRFVPEGTSSDNPLMLPLTYVGYDFLESLDIKITEGRNFSRNFPSDASEGFILNEKAVEKLGWENDPIGKKMELFAPGTSEIAKSGYIVGVVDNYHYESLHSTVRPLVLIYSPRYSYYVIRLDKGNMSSQVAAVENVWKKFSPEWPFEFFFLDSGLEQAYKNDEGLGKVVNYFAIIAVMIACLGLFGLAAFAAERRIKEVGIRKVLGASIPNLVKMLSSDFVKLVLIANVIAWPISYYTMNNWLEEFAYRIDINVGVFLIAGIITFLLALFTVSFQAVKAALSNPVEALKYE